MSFNWLTPLQIFIVGVQLGLFDRCIDGLQFARLFDYLVCDNDISILDVLEPVNREPALAALSCLCNVLFDVFERVERAYRNRLERNHRSNVTTHLQTQPPFHRLAARERDHVDR